MTKEQFLRHIEEKTGLLRPSNENGAMADEWNREMRIHQSINPKCPECSARRKTRRAASNRRNREAAYRSCGLTKVIGTVSGATYWE